MSLMSLSFFAFLLLAVIGYYLFPLRFRWLVLLGFSIYYYAQYNVRGFFYLIATLLVSYGGGWLIQHIYTKQDQYFAETELEKEEKKERKLKDKKKTKAICICSSIVVLLILVCVKVANTTIPNMIWEAVSGKERDAFNIIVPLGISYYTFSAVSYLADIYWKKTKAETNILKYFLFLLYFPKILQGPISRYKQVSQSLLEGNRFSYRQFTFGLQRMMWGYFKKMVIADRLQIFVSTVFGGYSERAGSILLVGALFSAFQLYCDFSGCMDIIMGASELFGVKLEENFQRPFFSKSAAEFWRRWHITLGVWFKDYVYMPLVVSPRMIKIVQKVSKVAGKQAGKHVMAIIPLSVVWLLTGLWHGTGTAYIVWGTYWGTIIIFSTVFDKQLKRVTGFFHINTEAKSWSVFQMVRTTFIFVAARIITVPNNLDASRTIFRTILSDFQVWNLFDGGLYLYGLSREDFLLACAALIVLLIVSLMQERGSVRENIASWNIVFRWGIFYLVFFSIIIFGMYGSGYEASGFVYMNY